MSQFGSRRIYYNNFAGHLLNAYNPNMLYPGLPYQWTDENWAGLLKMVAGFGFNVFDFSTVGIRENIFLPDLYAFDPSIGITVYLGEETLCFRHHAQLF